MEISEIYIQISPFKLLLYYYVESFTKSYSVAVLMKPQRLASAASP